jgi:NTP pyrophosphatase (non-canonical NTP hydrolase)
VTLDQYVAWAASVGAGWREPDGRAVIHDGLGLASEVGEVAGVLKTWLRDGTLGRDRLADELGDVAFHWARLSVLTGMAPSTLLARSRAHVEWRRAGRPTGGPAPTSSGTTLEEFTAWAADVGGMGPAHRSDVDALGDVGLALAGDAGEVVECLRRLAQGNDRERERLAGELGDVWRYWARLAVLSDVPSSEILARSRAKIEARRAGRAR